MADYKSMYLHLFNAITDAINILQKAQAESEEIFISQEDPEIIVFDKDKPDD